MSLFLVCYDIEDDAIRARVARCLLEYGERVQESVFEVTLATEADLSRLRQALLETMKDEQNLRLYRLCADCRAASTTLAGEAIATSPGVVIC